MKVIETKVIAGGAGAGLGAAVSGFLMWLLGVLIWHASFSALAAASAVAAVPAPVSLLTTAVLAAVGSGVSGYAAPHTFRSAPVIVPDLPNPYMGGGKAADAPADASTAVA